MRFRTARLYGRLLRFLRPHLGGFIASVVFMAAFAAFSGFTVAMIIPFTEIILSGKVPGQTEMSAPSAASATRPDAGDPGGDRTRLGTGTVDSGSPAAPADPSGDTEQRPDLRSRIDTWRTRALGTVYAWIRGADTKETVGRFCLVLFLIFLLKNLFWYAQSYLVVRVEQNVIRDIRNRLFAHYQTLSQDYFSASHSGVLISRVTNDVDLVRGAIANGIADLTRQSLLLVVYLGTVLFASWRFFLVAIVVLPPSLFLIDRIGHTLRRSSRVSQNKMARLTAVLAESLGGMRIIKAFGLESNRVARFSDETDSYARTMIRMTRIGSLASPLTEILGVLVACGLLWYAGTRIAGDEEASARFLMFLVGMLAMMQPIKMLSQVNIKIQQGLAAARRIFEVLDSRPSVAEPVHPRALDGFHDRIALRKVGFAYRADVPVLRDIDLEIPKGKVLALVGPSGGGKSTLVDLIPRFYDPTEGSITLDGVDLREIRLADLRAFIGLVTQETILFEGTITENIRMGRPDATDTEVQEAAHAANAHEFIASFPEGYDTWIGERGQLLSGGQRQRLSIARAILKNPEILIFDEATSALDSESEALVQEAIDRLLESRTAVVIAHRLSTVRHADWIVALADGRIVEAGTHETLLARNGLYRRLYEMQFQDRAAEPSRDRVEHVPRP
ncbi:MAG: ABC transporter ATP-binding protein [Candidatus Eisenbacteria bacterium]|uniref:ABC transporter ATP-binding protein n=1 Tax=Eiseniibacteriota bacterium TaxID=2212470 RepID=A0A956LW73_UNCEI|nr:ABC transporter ATP-binding protein [Candidatus Eisenbacteria bacterium]